MLTPKYKVGDKIVCKTTEWQPTVWYDSIYTISSVHPGDTKVYYKFKEDSVKFFVDEKHVVPFQNSTINPKILLYLKEYRDNCSDAKTWEELKKLVMEMEGCAADSAR